MICSFTGHRKIIPAHKKRIFDLLSRAIEYAYNEGCRTFLSGGAIGFDTEAARAVLLFKMAHPDVKLIMLLPCTSQDAYWTDSQRDAYNYLLRAADRVEYVSEQYTDDCMKKRNLRLAEMCDILIAYVGRGNSGSAQTMRFAQKMGKRVYNLYPTLEKNG